MKSPEVNVVVFFFISRQLKRERFHSAAPKIAQKVWMLISWRSGAEPQQRLTEARSRGARYMRFLLAKTTRKKHTHCYPRWQNVRRNMLQQMVPFYSLYAKWKPYFHHQTPFQRVRSNCVQHVLHTSLNDWYLIAEYMRIQIWRPETTEHSYCWIKWYVLVSLLLHNVLNSSSDQNFRKRNQNIFKDSLLIFLSPKIFLVLKLRVLQLWELRFRLTNTNISKNT